MPAPNQDRRRVIKAIVKGVVYSAPMVTSMAAPAGLMGQGPSGMMMMFCDFFPTLCMIFGLQAESTPGSRPAAPGAGAPGEATPAPTPTPPPPTPPPPGQINPPPGR